MGAPGHGIIGGRSRTVNPDPQPMTTATAADAPSLPWRQLRAVEAVLRCGGAAQAAAELHVSASAVSRAVQQAEARLGIPLFERGARGMSGTPAAALLVRRVVRAQQQLQQAAGPQLAARISETLLQVLLAVADCHSESAAARQLGLSQSAVHQNLRQLEHAARCSLFQHSRQGTRLTEAGEALLLRAKLALAELRAAEDELALLCGRAVGRVAVGALPMAADVLVPQALSSLLGAHPGIQVTVADGTYEALLHQLRQGDLDLVIGPLRGGLAPPDVAETPLLQDRLMPVVRSGHPALAAGVGRLGDLRCWPWIGPLPGTPARAAFVRAFAAAGLAPPAVAVQANSPAVVRSLLRRSDAVALVSLLQIRAELDAGLLAQLPVAVHDTERSIGLMQRRDGLPSPSQTALAAALQAAAAQVG